MKENLHHVSKPEVIAELSSMVEHHDQENLFLCVSIKIGSCVTVHLSARPSVCPYHRETNVKCRIF